MWSIKSFVTYCHLTVNLLINISASVGQAKFIIETKHQNKINSLIIIPWLIKIWHRLGIDIERRYKVILFTVAYCQTSVATGNVELSCKYSAFGYLVDWIPNTWIFNISGGSCFRIKCQGCGKIYIWLHFCCHFEKYAMQVHVFRSSSINISYLTLRRWRQL